MDGLKVAKLISGEFIIGRVTQGYIMNVMLVRFVADNSGQVRRTIVPYLAPISDSLGIIIGFDKVMAVIDSPEDLTTMYTMFINRVMSEQMKLSNNTVPQKIDSTGTPPDSPEPSTCETKE